MFRRIHWNNRGCKSIVWRCISRLEPTGLECHARTVNEEVLQQVVLKALNELLTHKESYQQQLQANIAYVIRLCARGEVQAINEQLLKLQQELLDKVNKRENYDEIADEIFQLWELSGDGELQFWIKGIYISVILLHSSTTFSKTPIDSISHRITSPLFKNTGGFIPSATPPGVPVAITVPASKVIPCDNSATASSTFVII